MIAMLVARLGGWGGGIDAIYCQVDTVALRPAKNKGQQNGQQAFGLRILGEVVKLPRDVCQHLVNATIDQARECVHTHTILNYVI